jgi:hypothetical protein
VLDGELGFAIFIFATICANTLVQLCLVYAQNHKMGRRRLMKEAATTILMLKPAIDSFRVAKGDEKNPNMLFDAEIELTMSRITETVFESVPSVSLPVSG